MKLLITVMTHPSREHNYFANLWSSLEQSLKDYQQSGKTTEVLLDSVNDADSKGVWFNSRNAFHTYLRYQDVTHLLVLQEDVSICKDFIETLVHLIHLKPHDVLGIYCPRKIIQEAREAGHSWAKLRDGIWGQGTLFPTHLIPIMFDWIDRHIKPEFPHDDSRYAMFCAENKLYVWHTVPSLIEHIGASDSIMGHSNRNRVAKWYIGDDTSGLSVDWNKGSFSPLEQHNFPNRDYYKFFMP